MSDEQFPDPTLQHLRAEAFKLSANSWRETFYTSQRGALYGAVPGLLCAIGVFVDGAHSMWLNFTAGCAIATCFSVVVSASLALRRGRQARTMEVAFADRMYAADRGEPKPIEPWVPPHLASPPVPHWLIKLQVRRDLKRGRFVPEIYRTEYWAGKWADHDE